MPAAQASARSRFKSPPCPQEEEGKRDQWPAVELRTAGATAGPDLQVLP